MEYIVAIILVAALLTFSESDHPHVESKSDVWWCFICASVKTSVVADGNDDISDPNEVEK